MPKKNKTQNRRNGRGKDSRMLATLNPGPSQGQGDLQQCRWVLSQQIPYVSTAATPSSESGILTPSVTRFTFKAGANGFSLVPSPGSADIQLYADQTGQFDELASLYEFYKLEGIKLVVMPSHMYGTGQVSPILSCIDPGMTRADGLGDVNFYSRARTTMLHPGNNGASRSIKYANWLKENVAAPYILTYDESTSQRQLYQNPNNAVGDASEPRLPSVVMSWEIVNNCFANVTSFVILVQAAYSFRGRRLKPLADQTRRLLKREEALSRMTDDSTRKEQRGYLLTYSAIGK